MTGEDVNELNVGNQRHRGLDVERFTQAMAEGRLPMSLCYAMASHKWRNLREKDLRNLNQATLRKIGNCATNYWRTHSEVRDEVARRKQIIWDRLGIEVGEVANDIREQLSIARAKNDSRTILKLLDLKAKLANREVQPADIQESFKALVNAVRQTGDQP